MISKLSLEARSELSEVLEQLGKVLDISESQYNAIVTSYRAVGSWLSASDSLLAPYRPEIIPQGSFMLGTMIPPSNGKDELDIDLVCRLTGKSAAWAQYHLKQIVGERLKQSKTYREMLDEEGRRCWTLNYADSARYHMDILPALVDASYQIILENSLSNNDLSRARELAIRITDNQEANYYSAVDPQQWPKSNPFGYGIWFHNLARIESIKAYALRDAIRPVPVYQKDKYPLQRAVQILKWHRDQLFNGDKEKPISIIITTLAAQAYEGQTDITSALIGIASRMASMIEERYDINRKRYIKWIANPVNPEENFADKWPENRHLEDKFYKWIEHLDEDLANIFGRVGQGYHKMQEVMAKPFGEKVVNEAFNDLAENARLKREKGSLKMAANTGLIGAVGRTVLRNHNNFGSND